MNDKYYPRIPEETILMVNRVFRTLSENPDYLNDPACPYPDVVKTFFNRQQTVASLPAAADEGEADEVASVEKQIRKLISDLDTFASNLKVDDTSERLQYLKTKAGLVEKLIGYQERITNLKQINEFRSIVVQFMDELLTKDQITTFMQRIDGVLSNGQ